MRIFTGVGSRAGSKWIVVAIVAFHMVLLAAYTAPEDLVPPRLRFWSQAYTLTIFHQRWDLFAPDPPRCSCELQVILNPSDSRPIASSQDHFLVRRMALQLGQYVGGTRPLPDTLVVDQQMEHAIRGLVRDIGREAKDLRFQAEQTCVDDLAHPDQRSWRIVPIQFVAP